MSNKYAKFERRVQVQEKSWKIHPVWRGIGCIILILVPVMAYAGAVLLVQANLRQGWMPLPPELYQVVTIPSLGSFKNLYAYLLFTVLLSLFGYAFVTVLFAIMSRFVSPPTASFDAPPVRRSPRKSPLRR